MRGGSAECRHAADHYHHHRRHSRSRRLRLCDRWRLLSQPIGVNATATSTNLAAGSHSVRLSKLAANCSVSGANPRSVTVGTSAAAQVGFAVACTVASGTIQITTNTTVCSPDPDGYTVAVDNASPKAIGVNATLTVPDVQPGTHEVTFAGLAPNCRANGDNPPPDQRHGWSHRDSNDDDRLSHPSSRGQDRVHFMAAFAR